MMKCSTHPDAPHGFDRNGSHSGDRYVCTCESWTPPATGEKEMSDHCLKHDQSTPCKYCAGEIAMGVELTGYWPSDLTFAKRTEGAAMKEPLLPEMPSIEGTGLTSRQMDYARLYGLQCFEAGREAAAKVCEGVEAERWAAYKDRSSARAGSDFVQGQSNGAELCAAAIRGSANISPITPEGGPGGIGIIVKVEQNEG
jgi:hypothetical protein